VKPSQDDLEDARQRCAEHYERCDCQRAELAKQIEPLVTANIVEILHLLSCCDRADKDVLTSDMDKSDDR